MTTIKIGGMHCSGCVARIEKALAAKDFRFSVSLENGSVEVDGDSKVIDEVKEIISDLGFDVL